MTTKFFICPEFFNDKEKLILEIDGIGVSTFQFSSGVKALRLKNSLGDLVILPYQGMQIWSAYFRGRKLEMVSMFDEPKLTSSYLETYGGFFLHCGFTAMGVPSTLDKHPLHGELPNAPYQKVFLEIGIDENGSFLKVEGSYQYTVAFSHNYLASPSIKFYPNSSLFPVNFQAKNLKNSPMEYMYLAHINFRPVNGGKLVYSAPTTPNSVRVRRSIPSHIHPGPEYKDFLDELAVHPEIHQKITPELIFDPEVVFFIDYLSDSTGFAHTMQIHQDGSSDYVKHNPHILNHGVRWISRTLDQDAMGMILPATAEPEGYLKEKEKGNIHVLLPGETFSSEITVGILDHQETALMVNHINKVITNQQS